MSSRSGRTADSSRPASLPRIAVNGRGLAAADYDNDGRVDVAVNTIGGKLVLLHNTGPVGALARGEVRPFSPGALVTVMLAGEHAGSCGKCRRAAATSRPRIRACTSGSAPRHAGVGAVVQWPDGTRTRLAHVRVNRILT